MPTTKNVVIHLNDRDEYEALLHHLEKEGKYFWYDSDKPTHDPPNFYDDMCLRLENRKIHHAPEVYYRKKGYKIISYREHMKDDLVVAESLTIKLVKAIREAVK